ncbi:MAG: M13 family metallopeptidase [Acidobacteriota bacterium]|nr:M13 family metallopeptidase [Acidobacteriota bacterium]
MRNSRKLALIAALLAAIPSMGGGAPETAATAAPSAGHVIDFGGMDPSADPGDDFYAYTNGRWMKSTQIPPDRSSFGTFSILEDTVSRRTADLIRTAGKSKGAAGSDAEKVGAFYAAYMDEKAIDDKGLSPLKAELDAVAGISDRASLARVLGSGLRADVDALNNTQFHTDRLFGLWVAPDFANPERNVAYLLQGGLGMPDRDNYLNTGEKDVELQGKYRAHLAALLKLAGMSDAEDRAGRVYALERKIAAAHGSRMDSVDVQKANNPWKLAEFATKAPGLDWAVYFQAAGLADQPMVMVWHPSAVAGASALAATESLELWKDYLTVRAIDRAAPLLPKAFAEERFHFYDTAMRGATEQRPRWKRAVDATGAALGESVGKLYVRRWFPASAKAEAQAMVRNLVEAFRKRIDNLAWMSPATRAKAKAKLDTLYVGIGYPDRWQDYSGLKVERGDALGNSERSVLFHYRWSLAKLGKPVDKTEWCMTPQTVNAVNLPLQNALNFPAAILNPPFFDAAAPASDNYGAIGAVIGHEIIHSFDDQGSQFDERGRLFNWWTPEDFAHFASAAEKLAAQYDAYEPLPGMHVNGKLTLSENIADVAGVSAAFDGYRAANRGRPGPARDGFTGDQRFFIAFGQAWRGKERPEALRSSLMTDGHAPGEFRADTVRNVDAWYEAFKVQSGRRLYLPPEARVRVW